MKSTELSAGEELVISIVQVFLTILMLIALWKYNEEDIYRFLSVLSDGKTTEETEVRVEKPKPNYYEANIVDVEGVGRLRVDAEGSFKGIRDVSEGIYALDWDNYTIHVTDIYVEEGQDFPNICLAAEDGSELHLILKGLVLDSDIETTGLYTLASRDGNEYELSVRPKGLWGNTILDVTKEYDISELEWRFEVLYYGTEEKDVSTWSMLYEPYSK